jgi:hypothetical protein
VISAIQSVPGVVYSDLDLLGTISETEAKDEDLLSQKLEELADAAGDPSAIAEERIPVEMARPGEGGTRLPAQLAFLNPTVPDTLILKELSA